MKIGLIGFSGSGKSLVSEILSKKGFCVFRTDKIRKDMFKNLKDTKASFQEGIYKEDITNMVYEKMINEAKSCENAVLDGSFLKRNQRDMARKVFKDIIFLWIFSDDNLIKERLKKRETDRASFDLSDANLEIYEKQKEIFEDPSLEKDVIKIENNGSLEELEKKVLNILKL